MNIIAQHLWDIKHMPDSQEDMATTAIKFIGDSITGSTIEEQDRLLTGLTESQKQDLWNIWSKQSGGAEEEWRKWESSEFHSSNVINIKIKELLEIQKNAARPSNENVLSLLWTYMIKDDGRYNKARCVCNGSKKMRGSVTLAETYAAALKQTGARLF